MKEGAFTNLMIIMLFRSDDITTKCVRNVDLLPLD